MLEITSVPAYAASGVLQSVCGMYISTEYDKEGLVDQKCRPHPDLGGDFRADEDE